MRHPLSLHQILLSLGAAALVLAACSTEMPPPTPVELAAEGDACAKDDDCATGLCASLPGESGSVCRRPCDDGCKAGEICTTFSIGAGGKLRAGCVPDRAGLCVSCEYDGDCPYPADACLSFGDHSYCGRDCAFDQKCPEGYTCAAEATSSSGDPIALQCVPASGSCSCTPDTVGQQRPCEKSNDFGRCTGEETCSESMVFEACDAREPAPEICNGTDDDCDGETDEELPEIECGKGECLVRVPGCVDGVPPACEPLPSNPETCNGRDDDCDGIVDNGFDLQADAANCGECGHACAVAHGTPICRAGSCAIESCAQGFGNCDAQLSTGCETDTTSSLLHCGSCNHSCPTPANAVASCNGSCSFECQGTWRDCNGQLSDGCESNTQTDLEDCGACGNKCPTVPNATSLCDQGSCEFACVGSWRDCNGDPADGCEADLQADAAHCGGCETACTAGPHATATCVAGSCDTACDPLWGDCNLSPVDGCEQSLGGDLAHCGSCDNACPSADNAAPSCENGHCGYACQSPYEDCNLLPSDGCETSLTTLSACGSCDNACPTGANGTPSCSEGACSFSCNSGYADCNAAAGCETSLNNLPAPPNCGSVTNLGEVDGDMSTNNIIVHQGRGEAMFKVHVDEENSSSIYVSTRVELDSPSGLDYDLFVYRDTCGSNATISTSGGAGESDFVDTCHCDGFLSEDAYDLYIEVKYFSGATCSPWTLTVTGNYLVQACEAGGSSGC